MAATRREYTYKYSMERRREEGRNYSEQRITIELNWTGHGIRIYIYD